MSELDLDAYFERIDWGGDTHVGLQTLSGLLDAHMRSVPFENLDVLLGRPIRLDLEGLQAKLVGARRGGYCFEHGVLFGAMLEKLGYDIARHTARVVLVDTREQAPRTHMFLIASLPQGRFVLDPGFGALAPMFPVPLLDADETAGLTHWMQRDGPWRTLRVRTQDKTVDAWTSTIDADNPSDFVLGNHYTSTYPASPFVNRMMLRAFMANGTISGMNRDVTFRRGGEAEQVQLADRRQLRALLAEHFGFDLPEVEHMRVPTIPEWT